VSLGIFSKASDKSMCPGVVSASKNEYEDIPGVKVAGNDLTTFICQVSRNLGALTSWTPIGHVGLERVALPYLNIHTLLKFVRICRQERLCTILLHNTE
jgi:hypothetical protein